LRIDNDVNNYIDSLELTSGTSGTCYRGIPEQVELVMGIPEQVEIRNSGTSSDKVPYIAISC
jgi:hypothetical protein